MYSRHLVYVLCPDCSRVTGHSETDGLSALTDVGKSSVEGLIKRLEAKEDINK